MIVEGNIGVGKTTLTQKLANDLKYEVFLEPSTDNPFLGMSELLNKFEEFDPLGCLKHPTILIRFKATL